MDTVIRPYRGEDEPALIELWNATMTHDRINESVFRTRVLLDPNFHPAGLLVAEACGDLVGFVLSIGRQAPLFLQGLEPELGWITGFGVHPGFQQQGMCRALFERAIARLVELGRMRVLISPYTSNYFIPGVDIDAYPAAAAFLAATGWRAVSLPIFMRAEFTGFQIPPEIVALETRLAGERITVRPMRSADLPELVPFIATTFGWDWYRLVCARIPVGAVRYRFRSDLLPGGHTGFDRSLSPRG